MRRTAGRRGASRRGAAPIAVLIACACTPALADEGRTPGSELPNLFGLELPPAALYPPTVTLGVILASLWGTARATGPVAYVHVVERGDIRIEYRLTAEGKIRSMRVRPAEFSPLDDDPRQR